MMTTLRIRQYLTYLYAICSRARYQTGVDQAICVRNTLPSLWMYSLHHHADHYLRHQPSHKAHRGREGNGLEKRGKLIIELLLCPKMS